MNQGATSRFAPPTDQLLSCLRCLTALAGCGLSASAPAAGYSPDAGFNGGQYHADAFATDSHLAAHKHSGQRVAQAANVPLRAGIHRVRCEFRDIKGEPCDFNVYHFKDGTWDDVVK